MPPPQPIRLKEEGEGGVERTYAWKNTDSPIVLNFL